MKAVSANKSVEATVLRTGASRVALDVNISEYTRIQMKTFESIVPMLLTFGPVMLVIGVSNTPNTFGMVIAYVGALMLSVGNAYLFRQLIHLRDQKTRAEKNT